MRPVQSFEERKLDSFPDSLLALLSWFLIGVGASPNTPVESVTAHKNTRLQSALLTVTICSHHGKSTLSTCALFAHIGPAVD